MDKNILYKMIFKRKSFHLFAGSGNLKISKEELDDIENVFSSLVPLNMDIKVKMVMVPANKTTCLRGAEYCILFYSEKKDGYLQNVGYLGEQLDLYLVSKDIGTLWFGIGRTKEKKFEGLDYVIMIAIHKVDDATKFRKDMFKSKRKEINEFWEGEQIEGVTDIVRFTPSACNSQPWFIKNTGDMLVYRYKKEGKRGIMPASMVPFYNRIDIGIFLYFLELCFEHKGIKFERELFSDPGDNKEFNLNAIYKLKYDNN